MKSCAGLLLTCARHGKTHARGTAFPLSLLNRYATQVIGVPSAKVTSMVDLLQTRDIVHNDLSSSEPTIVVRDIEFLDRLLMHLNDVNLTDQSKRVDLSDRGFRIFEYIVKNLPKFPPDPQTGAALVSIETIQRAERRSGMMSEIFRPEEVNELVRTGFVTSVLAKAKDEHYISVVPKQFAEMYQIQAILHALNVLNEQKRKTSQQGGR